MSESTTRKLITRGVPTKILNFDGPSFSLQITQRELHAGLAKNMALEKRTTTRHLKGAQVEKSMKETRMAKTEKRKFHISEASSVKGKEVEASKSSDEVEEKGIKFFVKHQEIFALHISVYTNTDIVSELKENLTPEQYKQLGNTCFGNFLQMKHCEVQHQLFRCFMALQLEGTPKNVFAIHVNGTSLHFTLREFALVTGLKCVGNDVDFEFSEKVPNRIIETYFGGANLVKKKHLMKCFADKNWGPDNDAFETLTKSISKKMDAHKKYYRIAGMPLAMEVWFYKCCSDVDPKIDDVVPRILNWRTTRNKPNFAYLMNDMFNDNGNMKYTVAYRYIFDALIPAVVSDVVSAIIFDVIFSYVCYIQLHTNAYRFCIHEIAYICKGCIQQYTVAFSCINMLYIFDALIPAVVSNVVSAIIFAVIFSHIVYKDIHPSDIELAVIQISPVGADVENKPTPAHSDKSGEDSDDFSPTPGLQCKKKHIASVGPSSSPPHKKCKEHERHPNETEYQSKIPPVCVSEFGQNVLHDNQLPDSKNDEVSSLRKNLNSFNEYEYDKWVRDGLLARHDQRSNLEDHYKKNKSTLHIPLDFVVDQVNSKNWFYLLSFDGKLWDDNLYSVVLNCIIHMYFSVFNCIIQLYSVVFFLLSAVLSCSQLYADTDSNTNVAKEEDVVLVVVSFKERCIKVYDSYRSAGHDAYVTSEIDKLAKLVPLYLSISGFYRDSQGIDWFTYSAYTDKSHNDPFEVFFHIRSASTESWEHVSIQSSFLDCGLHVAAYAEFLSIIGEIPQTTFDSNLLRQRYGALLWDYAMRKIDDNAISENEASSKIARQITKSDSKMQIVLE
ncbi:uncharacterized protein [Nicotiana sylvestris]|uniref:uncharacterized protein n=1 Tax=Nicotiana sylvestris TaxID=4096 RepID=UPI00388C701C